LTATRRDALRCGLVAGSTVVAASSTPLLGLRNALAKGVEDDAAILERALKLEQTAVVAYDAALESGLLRQPLAELARRFRGQEREHANALTAALEDLDRKAPRPPTPEQVGLGRLEGQDDVLRFLIELENMTVVAYIDVQRRLEDEALLRTVAQIMANEGQHLVVLREALGNDPVPDAFEAGTS
jgi:rubrerythrin